MLLILKSYTIAELKKEISKQNIKGYSKMKKNEVIELMMQNKDKFSHITMKAKKERSEKQKANDKKLGEMAKNKNKKKEPEPEPKPEPEPEAKVEKKVKKVKKASQKEATVKASQKEAFEALDDVKFQLSQLINKYQSTSNKKDKSKLELQMQKLENQILQIKLKGSKY